jgi:hypothetical protein
VHFILTTDSKATEPSDYELKLCAKVNLSSLSFLCQVCFHSDEKVTKTDTRHTKKQESVVHSKKENKSTKTISEEH